MGFDYNQTCPDIDSSIRDLKQSIKDTLDDLLKEVCPMLSEDIIENLADRDTEHIYDLIDGSVEKIRDTNSDMRKEAERQVEELEDEILKEKQV